MTQRERVLSMLRSAGERGVRSDAFIAAYMPRAAARIQELRDGGVEISSEREGKYVRYRIVGVGAGSGDERKESPLRPSIVEASVDPGEPESRLFELPSMSAQTNREAA